MEIVNLTPNRYRDAARMLARAFADDPMWCFVEPDPGERPRKIAWIMERWARLLVPLGMSWAAIENGAVAGAAMWFPPGQFERVSPIRMLRAGYGLMPFALGFRWSVRSYMIFLEGLGHPAELMREPGQRPFFVLDMLGVDPSRQGQGIGAALLQKGLDVADAQHSSAFLVTHKPSNRPFYERFGFEVIDEYKVSGGGPVAYTMRRPEKRET